MALIFIALSRQQSYHENMIRIYQKNVKQNQLKQLDKFKIGSWIYVVNPSVEELEQLTEDFELDQGLLKDGLDPLEVPRVEVDSKIVYIYIRLPIQLDNRIVTTPLLLAISQEYLLTFSKEEPPLMEKFLNDEIIFFTTQKTKLFLQMLSQINLSFHHSLTEISKKVRGLSGKLEKISNIKNQDLIQFVTFEEALNDFIAALAPINAILQDLISKRSLTFYEQDIDLIEDLQLSNDQLITACKSTLKTIVNIREAYSAILTNNLNQVIKLFTALTILLTVPNVITGFYGMNIALPLLDQPLTYLYVLVATLIIWTILIFIFFKNRWF